ncbi:hypothetical protein LSM04_009459 [Trypanosoma melophagium]|uniref:uncharacterized protein n=1 Tax=Trypanosoma melophagium TaxID=715481 RepID=UPI00351AA2BE|nr:hypothetical protein LSM04_009459 [Trypanosoma melophagium]
MLCTQQSGKNDTVAGNGKQSTSIANQSLPSLQHQYNPVEQTTNGKTNVVSEKNEKPSSPQRRGSSMLTTDAFLSPLDVCLNVARESMLTFHRFSSLDDSSFYECGYFNYYGDDYDNNKGTDIHTKPVKKEASDKSISLSRRASSSVAAFYFSHSIYEYDFALQTEATPQKCKEDDVNLQTPLEKTTSSVNVSAIYESCGISSMCFAEPVQDHPAQAPTLMKSSNVEEQRVGGEKTKLPKLSSSERQLKKSRDTSILMTNSKSNVSQKEPLPVLKSSTLVVPKPPVKVSRKAASSKVKPTPPAAPETKEKDNFKVQRMRRYGICLETSSSSEDNKHNNFRLRKVALLTSHGDGGKKVKEREKEGKEKMVLLGGNVESMVMPGAAPGTVTVTHRGELHNGCLLELKADYNLDDVITTPTATCSADFVSLLQHAHCGVPSFMPVSYATGCHAAATRLCRNIIKYLVRMFREGAQVDDTRCNVWISLCGVTSPRSAVDLLRSTAHHEHEITLNIGFMAFCGPFFMNLKWMEVTSEEKFCDIENIILRRQCKHTNDLIIGTLVAREYVLANRGDGKGWTETLLLPSFTFALTNDHLLFTTIARSKPSPLGFFFVNAFDGGGATVHVSCVADNSTVSGRYFENAMRLPQPVNSNLRVFDVSRQYLRAYGYLKEKQLSRKNSDKGNVAICSFMQAYKSSKTMLMNPSMFPMECMRDAFSGEVEGVKRRGSTFQSVSLPGETSSRNSAPGATVRSIRDTVSRHLLFRDERILYGQPG